jgi:hypothetical protein
MATDLYHPIQFGSFQPIDTTAFLENVIFELQQQNALLIQQSIERDNILQCEKDEFMSGMTAILHKNTLRCDELMNEKLACENLLTTFTKKSTDNYNELLQKNKHQEDEIAELKKTTSTFVEQLAVANNEIARLKTDAENTMIDLARARATAATVKIMPHRGMVSIGVECSLGDEEVKLCQKKIEHYEKGIYESADAVNNLVKEVENERSISAGLLKTLKIKEAIAFREKSLREDFEYLCNTMRMYLEVEMTKMAAEIEASGIAGFAIAAFSMYKGYCTGAFEEILVKAINARKITPEMKSQFQDIKENVINERVTTVKKAQKKKR